MGHIPSRNNELAGALRGGQFLEASAALNSMRDNPSTYMFSGLTIPSKQKFTTIDLVVVIGKECIIAEMKNYSKSLEGTISSNFWIAKTKTRQFTIRNPFKQNQYHCIALSSALIKAGINISKITFMDFIVVPNSCELIIPDAGLKYIKTQGDWEWMLREKGLKFKRTHDTVNNDMIEVMNGWRSMIK